MSTRNFFLITIIEDGGRIMQGVKAYHMEKEQVHAMVMNLIERRVINVGVVKKLTVEVISPGHELVKSFLINQR